VTAPVLADAMGPRARRRALLASIAAALLVIAFLVVAYNRLSDRGQLVKAKWEPFTEWPVLRFLLGGLGNTLKAAAVAMAFAMAIGGLMALARLARHGPQRWLATLYIEFFRALPLYLLLLFCGFGLPQLDVRLEPFWYLVIGLSVYNSSILAEIFRAGILSLDRGQSEAAYSLGLGYWQSMGLVVIPQAVRRMVPAVVSQLVTLLKDTSLGVVIFYEELLRRARITGEYYQNPVHAIVLAALFYIPVHSLLRVVARRLETRQRRRYGAGAIQVDGAEDLALTQAEATAKV